jgi:hypothetical protein
MARDARMFTIGGGTAQILRTQVAGAVLGLKLPQTRGAHAETRDPAPPAAVEPRTRTYRQDEIAARS